MGDIKAAGVVFVRDQLLKPQPSKMEVVTNALTEREREIFQRVVAISLLPIEVISSIYAATAKALYPELDPAKGVFEIGRLLAHDNLSGIYRVLVRVFTTAMVMQQAAVLWKKYHQQGEARIEEARPGENYRQAFVVSNYTSMPKVFRDTTDGYIHGTVELTGAKNIRVTRVDTNPNQWRWQVDYR